MFKLRKYLKPFVFATIITLCLLFVQAICDLKLPNLMSQIVNVGIQSSGIENAAPNAISSNGLSFITTFMSDEERKMVKDNYIKMENADNSYLEEYKSTNKDVYLLNRNITQDELKKLNKAFSVASRTALNILNSQSSNLEGFNVESSNSLEEIYNVLPSIANISSETINKNREDALLTDDETLNQIGIAFTKLYYKEIGIDIGSIQNTYILKTGVQMLGITILIVALSIIITLISTLISKRFARNLTKDVFAKVVQFSDQEYDKLKTSSLITRTTNDISQTQNLIFSLLQVVAYAPIMGIGAIIMILQTNSNMSWILGLGCLVIFILMIIVYVLVLPKIKILQKLTDKINLISREIISGTMVTRAFRNQKHEEKRFEAVNQDINDTYKFLNRIWIGLMPAMTLVMNGITIMIVWIGAKQIASSDLMVGDMMAFIQYSMQVIMAFLMFSSMFIMYPRAAVSAKRIAEVLETEVSIKEPIEPKEFNKEKMGYVEFKNVSFKYPDAEENVIENVSFVAKPGETTAFIGSTGSGKSTLIKLVPRFYDVTEGEVLVNGVNVKEVRTFDLYEQIGYIPQTASLLTGTIESNLKYGNPDASDELMEKTVEVAQASEFIEQKEEGYKSQISQSGKNVSGGQKQRLAIARALVKEAPIYIFDDSFSALDMKTDSMLRKALKEYNKNSTVLIVAQRISSIMNSEQIIVMDNGKIVGKGTHKELLKTCPTYYEIASSQLKKEEL